ncbi:MAG: glycosyltransferase [Planctomycetota bacterium]
MDRAFPKRILLLSGPRSKGLDLKTLREVSSVPIEHVPLPRLEYDSVLKEKGAARHDGQSMTAEIHGALQRHDCDPQNTVIHWHNYSLGKNLASPDAVRGLHTLGYRLLLQIHDFAEDNRPANLAYLLQGFGDGDIAAAITDWLYPDLPNVHYACLTYGDTSRVQSLGLCHGSVSTLPNPVLSHADATSGDTGSTNPGQKVEKDAPDGSGLAADSQAKPNQNQETKQKVFAANSIPEDAKLVLYPVRGIRRKNVGEMLMLAAMMQSHSRKTNSTRFYFGITLRPKNPREASSYEQWRQLAQDLELPVCFDMGMQADITFDENVAAADWMLSTSVAEGFGMVFLESSQIGSPLLARDLPGVTEHFRNAGIQFPHLYDQLSVPLTSLHYQLSIQLRQAIWRVAVSQLPHELAGECPGLTTQQLPNQPRRADFAHLPTQFQSDLIRQVTTNSSTANRVLEWNQGIVSALTESDPATDQSTLADNRKSIDAFCGQQASRRRLGELYHSILADHVVQSAESESLQRQTILSSFSNTADFAPCRVE